MAELPRPLREGMGRRRVGRDGPFDAADGGARGGPTAAILCGLVDGDAQAGAAANPLGNGGQLGAGEGRDEGLGGRAGD